MDWSIDQESHREGSNDTHELSINRWDRKESHVNTKKVVKKKKKKKKRQQRETLV